MKYSEHYEVTCHDVDQNNHIKPTNLVRYMQETANHQMRDRKPSYYDLFFDGKAFIVTRMNIKIHAQLQQYDKIEAHTWICPGKAATFPRCYEILRGDELVAEAYSEWAVANRITGKLCGTNEIDIIEYEQDEALTLSIPRRYHFPKDLRFEPVGEHHVFYSDCDMNRHMNNANYSDLLWNYIPEICEKEVTSINIRFMREAALGTDIEIFAARPEISLGQDDDAEELYAFRTRVNGATNVECLMGVRRTETQERPEPAQRVQTQDRPEPSQKPESREE